MQIYCPIVLIDRGQRKFVMKLDTRFVAKKVTFIKSLDRAMSR